MHLMVRSENRMYYILIKIDLLSSSYDCMGMKLRNTQRGRGADELLRV